MSRRLRFRPMAACWPTCGSSFGDYSRVFRREQRLDERSTGPGRLKIWDVKTGTLKHDLVGHSDANAVSFSPDGSVLASAGSWLSDAETGNRRPHLEFPDGLEGSQLFRQRLTAVHLLSHFRRTVN